MGGTVPCRAQWVMVGWDGRDGPWIIGEPSFTAIPLQVQLPAWNIINIQKQQNIHYTYSFQQFQLLPDAHI